ncbi:acetyltransferase [Pseudomonas sp. 8AS]|uniref:acetyltransferase n=1 Tax=Pseudomonas sp. 8AS TaxID=2653163 RepID=UPI00135AA18D|nr:acetyltransferase [Pseudomonas sp. 8AS]
MKRLLVIGEGRALGQAYATARESGLDCRRIELHSPDRYNFDLSPLFERHVASETEVFVALDERAVNFARHKLIAEVRLAGYGLLNIVSPRAIVSADVRLLGNVYVGPGCNLADRCSLGTGSWLSRQVVIETGSRLGSCVTLDSGVLLGGGTEIGVGSTLGSGSVTLAGTKIGRYCEWFLPGVLPEFLPNRSFYDRLMPEGARILSN